MSYIGNTNTTQSFTPAIDYFSGNGSTTAFTLSRPVASVAQVQVTIDNVAQNPSSAYTVSANTITFTSAPLSGTNNIYVYYTSPITQVIAPGQGTVNTTALGNITNIASGNSSLTLQTGSGNTTAVTIDTSQNVGIGTATPSSFYSEARNLVVGTGTGGQGISIYAGSASQSRLMFANGTAGSQAYNGFVQYDHSSNTLQFGTNGGSERMRIDSSGNVGIGTSSPLSIAKQTIKQASGGGTGSTQLHLEQSNTTDGYDLKCDSADGALAFLRYESGSATERMRISSAGYFLVNKTSPTTYGGIYAQTYTVNSSGQKWLQVWDSTVSTAGQCQGLFVNYSAATPNGGGNEFIYCLDSTNQRFSVLSNGGIKNYSANNVNLSDRREKTNFAPAKSYLNTICSIPVQTFNYIDQNREEDDGLTLGVVAQDVQAVAPELVHEANWGTEDNPKMRLSIYQTDLQYALMKSIQELKAINDQQAETINALTARIEALENR